MIVEIILRQHTGEDALRIGSLPSISVGDRVRIDGRADWVIARCLLPAYVGGPRRVVCERLARRRRAA